MLDHILQKLFRLHQQRAFTQNVPAAATGAVLAASDAGVVVGRSLHLVLRVCVCVCVCVCVFVRCFILAINM